MRVETLQPTGRTTAARPTRLSVPSMWVETLQPRGPGGQQRRTRTFSTLHAGRDAATYFSIRTVHRETHFQYPPCGSRRCNESQDGEGRCSFGTFSTLHAGRDAATSWPPRSPHKHEPIFQYPPCGSRRCNSQSIRFSTSSYSLSVPSMRVETLQPRTALGLVPRARLSVPSMRVETLQLPRTNRVTSAIVIFQYPPCGSRRCNRSIRPWQAGLIPPPFSTLHAGRDAATPVEDALLLECSTFSTLHAGRDAATGRRSVRRDEI